MTSSSSGGSSNNSAVLTMALSIGVFVGTTLLSQWLQHRLSLRSSAEKTNDDNDDDDNDDDDDADIYSSWGGSISDGDDDDDGEACIYGAPGGGGDDDDDARDLYRYKRRRRRLSFTRNEPYNHNHPSTDDDGSISARSSPTDDDDDDDDANESLMPKNRNWDHFERHHQQRRHDDYAQRQIQGDDGVFHRTLSSPSASGRGVMSLSGEDVLAAYEDSDDVDDDEAIEDSDDISHSSSDQFVWTNARYSPRRHRQARSTSETNNKSRLPVILSEQQIALPLERRASSLSSAASSSRKKSKPPRTPTTLRGFASSNSLQRRTASKKKKDEVGTTTSFTATKPPKHSPALLRSRTFSANDLPKQTHLLRGRSLPLEHSKTSNKRQQQKHHAAATEARAAYNARIMPHKVVMIRHGQSMGNENEHLYAKTPDNAMPLTKLGWEQANAAGQHLRNVVLEQPDHVHFIVSPYVRTVETFHGVVSAWCDPAEFAHIADREERLKAWYGRLVEMGLTWQEDPRIREQGMLLWLLLLCLFPAVESLIIFKSSSRLWQLPGLTANIEMQGRTTQVWCLLLSLSSWRISE